MGSTAGGKVMKRTEDEKVACSCLHYTCGKRKVIKVYDGGMISSLATQNPNDRGKRQQRY